jgi:hypothetical protein
MHIKDLEQAQKAHNLGLVSFVGRIYSSPPPKKSETDFWLWHRKKLDLSLDCVLPNKG